MDGTYGHKLKVKANAATNPLFKSQYVCDQDKVDAYVVEASKRPDVTPANDCSDFKVGGKGVKVLVQKAKGLCVKGCFGAACRHNQPLIFANMKTSEK